MEHASRESAGYASATRLSPDPTNAVVRGSDCVGASRIFKSTGHVDSGGIAQRMSDTEEQSETWLVDMDGVLMHEETALPGAEEFVDRLWERERQFLVLTNNSIYTRRDLAARLAEAGLDVPEERIWTSAVATARFLSNQAPDASAYVIGEAGLKTALHDVGYTLTDTDPDFVVLGESRTYSFQNITEAVRLLDGGARFVATNPDATGPSPEGPLPATGSVAALLTEATSKEPYFIGKPNPIMIRSGLNRIGAHSESTAMIGDRMNTDVVAGIEAGLTTYLVLTGSTERNEITEFAYRPDEVVESVSELIDVI